MRCLLRSSPFRFAALAYGLFFLLSLVTRIALLAKARNDVTYDFSLASTFAVGIYHDLAAGIFAMLPWLLFGAVTPTGFLKSKAGRVVVWTLMTIFAGLLIFICISEWFFWDEFGVRFNFIAVNYLIWTREVLANIRESYPMVPIIGALLLAAGAVTWTLERTCVLAWAADGISTKFTRIVTAVGGFVMATLSWLFVSQGSIPAFTNEYHAELAKNGPWSFFKAFKEMELDYTMWYRRLPNANERTKKLLATSNEVFVSDTPEDLQRVITATGPEHRWNVILICIESYSGDYMSYVRDKLPPFAKRQQNLSPNLERLASQSIFFDNFYATGTRTVRGMEALTLGLPPAPGQAIFYRPEGKNLLTTFTPFTNRGYDCAFIYGGDGKFDYMNRFFATAGCRIVDVPKWAKTEVTFKTAWGACDEDLFNKTISEADKAYADKKPFHYFCMTTSNHRPFDFPPGRVDMPQHERYSAVKYSDWAVGDLVEKASKKPWFSSTLFIFVADHCAGSAGKSELPVTNYHIPAIIYNPQLVQPKTVSGLCSQVDLMPTVFGLLNWSHETLGYGYDRLATTPPPTRAFISNYQRIALYRDDRLAILKPKSTSSLYNCDPATFALTPMPTGTGQDFLDEATAYYQSASWLFKSGRIKNPSPPKTDY